MYFQPFDSGGADRGVSEVLGVVLLVAIVIVSVSLVAIAGAQTIGNSQNEVSYEQAKLAMGELADAAQGTGGGVNESVDFGARSANNVRVNETAGTLRIRNYNDSETTLDTNRTLGTVVYEGSGREVAMQGGGVWMTSDDTNQSAVFQRPPVDYRKQTDQYPTLSMSVVRIDGEARNGQVNLGGTNVSDVLAEEELPPESTLEIAVTSEYYRGWGEVFEEQVGEEFVSYDDDARTVQIELTIQRPDVTPVSGAIVSPTGDLGDTFDMDNTVSAYPDGTKTPTVVVGAKSTDGVFKAGGGGSPVIEGNFMVNSSLNVQDDFNVKNNTHVYGDLAISAGSGNHVTFNETVYVSGNLTEVSDDLTFEEDLVIDNDVASGVSIEEDMVDGDIYVNGDILGDLQGNLTNSGNKTLEQRPTNPNDAPSATSIISDEAGHIPSENNNTDVSCINSDNEFNSSLSNCTLSSGDYHLSVTGQVKTELQFDTRGGPVNIYLENDGGSIMPEGNIVHSEGSHPVNIYYDASEATSNRGMNIKSDEIGNTSGHASKFNLYINRSNNNGSGASDLRFERGSNFTGLIYGLGGETSDPARINMGSGNTYNGAIMGKVVGYDESNNLNYDRRLSELGFGEREPSDTSDGEVRYVYISDVEATAD